MEDEVINDTRVPGKIAINQFFFIVNQGCGIKSEGYVGKLFECEI
jgi:hypothetical protein